MLRAVSILLLATSVLLSGCLGDPIDPDEMLPPEHDEHHDGAATPPDALGAATVVLEAHAGLPDDELALHPSPLRVALGSVVEIRVQNQGRAPHTFTIHTFDVGTGVLGPGEAKTIEFRADEAGRFEISCDVPGHYQNGMKGTIEVVA